MIRRVSGRSMFPALQPGNIIIALRKSYKVGSIVIANINNREVIKRVTLIKKEYVYLQGDNASESTDSRHYGPVHKSVILGTVMITLPKAIKSPKLVKPYGPILGRAAAFILVLMSLIHLFRIDTLIPILDAALPGGQIIASILTVLIILIEIFAVPFALRMKLSPLGHLVSGAFVVLTPLSWVWVTIWAYGSSAQIGQLGEFVPVYASALVLVVNLIWVTASYYTLYTLGYNRLSVRSLLRK